MVEEKQVDLCGKMRRYDKLIIPESIQTLIKETEEWLLDLDSPQEYLDDTSYIIVTKDELYGFFKKAHELYRKMLILGVPAEDAELILPCLFRLKRGIKERAEREP